MSDLSKYIIFKNLYNYAVNIHAHVTYIHKTSKSNSYIFYLKFIVIVT